MITFPNAKINLGLNIVNKRSDGYHDIESVFYPIGWSDMLEIIPADKPVFDCSGLPIPGGTNDNLIIKACELLKGQISEVHIHLHKTLPMGAGIGGGSADAAFTLKMLNEIFALNFSTADLQDLASKLGSDCAFFIENTPKFCFACGNEFKNIDLSLKGKFIVLVNPEIHISTAEAYAGIIPHKPEKTIEEIISLPVSDWKNLLINDFEMAVVRKYPTIQNIKNTLYEIGAVYASMTGSGSTVFGIFDSEIADLDKIFNKYTYWQGLAAY